MVNPKPRLTTHSTGAAIACFSSSPYSSRRYVDSRRPVNSGVSRLLSGNKHEPKASNLLMNQRIKTTLISLLEPKSIIVGFALFNFILIWIQARSLDMSGIACVVCPWYDPWSYTNEPTRLLIAALSLWLNRAWSYVIAFALGGYMVAHFVYLFIMSGASLLQEWRYLQKYEPYIVGSFDSQYILALIISGFAAYYLARDIMRRNASRRTASNNSFNRSAS